MLSPLIFRRERNGRARFVELAERAAGDDEDEEEGQAEETPSPTVG